MSQKDLLEPGSADLTINFHLERLAVVEIGPLFPCALRFLAGAQSFGGAHRVLQLACCVTWQALANDS
jgi:hypothetical protein